MKKIFVVLLSILITAPAVEAGASASVKTPGTGKSDNTNQAVPATTTDSIGETTRNKEFQKLTAGAKVDKGMFTIYASRTGNYYFEIPDSMLKRDMLFGSRVSAISDNSKISAGQRRSNPVLIHFTVRDKTLLMHKPTGSAIANPNDPIAVALDRNNLVPAVMSFDIAARNHSNDASLVDVTKLFASEIELVFPAGAGNTGRLDPKASYIESMKSFPGNLEVKSHYNYSGGRDPFSITVNYSFILLTREPMRPRLNDERIGFSSENKRIFESGKPFTGAQFIDRWRIEASPEDVEKHRRGEKVIPAKPIVFYVDTIMPEQWRRYVKMGIEDWNAAFEKIGFIHTIKAVDFPRDKNFDPDDSRYNCFRYVASTDANAQGPQWIDPRSGEIIQGDIIWWHNVIDLLQTWRFVQTAAADPEARKKILSDEILGESIRYAVAHEMGHVLGLQHNMRASYAYPTDSLRSATFTQQYGTTASIMDYARNNYIAQPGDKEKGVRMTPPVLGPQDFFSIQVGYQPIYEAASYTDELPVLNRWYTEKGTDPVYQFGSTTVSPIIPDPSAQADALGNDLLKSSEYGISNLKYITKNLIEWTLEEGDSYDLLRKRFDAVMRLHSRLTTLPLSYLGGVYTFNGSHGQYPNRIKAVEKTKQQETVKRTLLALTDYQWLINPDLSRYLGNNSKQITDWQSSIINHMLGNFITSRIFENSQSPATNSYSPREYLSDLDKSIWETTVKREAGDMERHIQLAYLERLCALVRPLSNTSDKQEVKSGNETSWASTAANQLLQTRRTIERLQRRTKSQKGHYQLMINLINNTLPENKSVIVSETTL